MNTGDCIYPDAGDSQCTQAEMEKQICLPARELRVISNPSSRIQHTYSRIHLAGAEKGFQRRLDLQRKD